jgi:hypothetical protein
MLPITDQQAKAIQSSAELGNTVIEESSALARYLANVLGTVPRDTVGLVLGDPLHAVRAIIAAKLDDRVKKIHCDRNVKETEPVSPSLAIPLLKPAYPNRLRDFRLRGPRTGPIQFQYRRALFCRQPLTTHCLAPRRQRNVVAISHTLR